LKKETQKPSLSLPSMLLKDIDFKQVLELRQSWC
jgi:hypothetical protein